MGTRPLAICTSLILGLGLLLAGCGGGEEHDDTAANRAQRASHERQRRLAREVGTRIHLDRADCRALGKRLAQLRGERPRTRAETSPPQSRCAFSAPGLDVNVYLDASRSAHQRYENRIDEQVQFGTPDPRKLPHAVAGVGEPSPYSHSANWVPALRTLLAVRGHRWLTVAYSVPALSDAAARKEAADLARLAFSRSGE